MSTTSWGSPVNLMAMPAPLKRFISLQRQIALARQAARLPGAAICSPTTSGLFSNTALSIGNPLWKRYLAAPTAHTPSNNAWDFVIGGGLDIPLSKNFSIRPAQFDFVLTRFGNGFTGGNNNQSNFRYNGGVVIRW